MKVKMVSLFVNDPNKAFTYYTETLGFEKLMHMPEMSLAIVVSPEEPKGVGILLEPNENPIAKTYQDALWAANLPCIVLGTKDINADYDRLKSKGVIFRKPPTKNEWGTEAVFEDTCGNLILLHEG